MCHHFRRGLSGGAAVSYHEGMEPGNTPDRPGATPVGGGRFSWKGLLVALAAGVATGLVWARVADAVQVYVAPIIVFPIMVGVFAGLTIVAVVRFAQIGHRPTILAAAAFAAAVAALGQHYFEYLAAYSQPPAVSPVIDGEASAVGDNVGLQEALRDFQAIQRQLTPSFGEYLCAQAKRGRPLPWGYVAAGWVAWLTWAIDALLTLASAVVVTLPAIRIPYCNRCGTWYRTIRNGKIDVPTAQRLAETCGVEDIAGLRSPRYRLSCCQGGCSPTRCELSWEAPHGSVALVRMWLDNPTRNQIVAILDELAEEDQNEE